jgi:hypothetical protein
MSKYVTDRNGVTIGYDNTFFYWDEWDDMHHFGAIVTFQPIYLKQINSLNYDLNSYAHQLCFKRRKYHWPTTALFMPHGTTHAYRLSDWWVRWLDKNTPGWGYPPVGPDRERSQAVFFKRLKDARLFRAEIAKHLEGVPPVPKRAK